MCEHLVFIVFIVIFSSSAASVIIKFSVFSVFKPTVIQRPRDRPEFLPCSSRQRMHQLPVSPVLISGNSVDPASVVRDLGVWIDRGLSINVDARHQGRLRFSGGSRKKCLGVLAPHHLGGNHG